MKMESSGWFCDLCKNVFPSQKEYDDHLFRIWEIDQDLKSFTEVLPQTQLCTPPASEQQWTCHICQLTLKNEKGLKQHIGKVHMKQFKGVYCSACHKKFKHKYALRFHVNQVHKQATRVKCPFCSLDFYNKYMLKGHIQKHHASHS